MNLNKVTLAGRLTRDPEVRYTPKGTAVAKFGLAVNRTWKSEAGEKKEEVAFIDCDCFGRTAENIAQYFRKGAEIYLEGRLKLDTWQDKQSGQNRSKLGVLVDTFQFVGKRDKSEEPESAPAPSSAPAAGGPEEDDAPPF